MTNNILIIKYNFVLEIINYIFLGILNCNERMSMIIL